MVNKLLLYILLMAAPLVSAQPVADTVTVAEVAAVQADTVIAHNDRAFRPDFKNSYQGDDFRYEVKGKSKSIWERFLEWLNNLLRKIFGVGDGESTENVIEIIIRVLAILIVLFVVYLIIKAVLNKEGMWIFGKSRRDIRVNELSEQELNQMDFRQLTEETAQAGKYRLAVRYYYLWLLKRLADREIIDWHQDKTNSDYLYEISNPALRKDFEYLSYVYDYSWYGEFDIDETAFRKAQKAFLKTINSI